MTLVFAVEKIAIKSVIPLKVMHGFLMLLKSMACLWCLACYLQRVEAWVYFFFILFGNCRPCTHVFHEV